MIILLKSKHFDPQIADAFLAVQEKFNRVRKEKIKLEANMIRQPARAAGR